MPFIELNMEFISCLSLSTCIVILLKKKISKKKSSKTLRLCSTWHLYHVCPLWHILCLKFVSRVDIYIILFTDYIFKEVKI